MPDIFFEMLPAIVPVAIVVFILFDHLRNRKKESAGYRKTPMVYFWLILCIVIIIGLILVILQRR